MLNILLFKDDKVAVAVIAAQYAAVLITPLAQAVTHSVTDVVFRAVGLAAEKLVKIVYDDDARHRARVLILDADVVILRQIHPVCYGHNCRARVGILAADDAAVYLILAPVNLNQAGVMALPLGQPPGAELRHHVRHARVEPRTGRAAHVEKHLVAPDYARIVQPENGHRQGEIHQGVALGVFRVIGYGLYILR